MTDTPQKPDFEHGPALRTIAMPADTNANGDMFGGWMLSQMDLAGASLAMSTAQSRVATVGVQAMTFYRPVFVGDEVSCFSAIDKIGNTSITISIETWVRRRLSRVTEKVTEGKFTYVAIDEKGKPTPVLKKGIVA